MQICPNCKKELNNHFEYCNSCGSSLNNGISGDYTTNITNVFKHFEEYIYLFTLNGLQKVIKAKTVDELRKKVIENNFPWIVDGVQECNFTNTKSNTKISKSENYFLKISAQSENTCTSKYSHNPKNKVGKNKLISNKHVIGDLNKSVRKNQTVATNNKPQDYGIFGVYRTSDNHWAFKRNDSYPIKCRYLHQLKKEVLSQGLLWKVSNDTLASQTLNDDKKKFDERQNEIRSANQNHTSLSVWEKRDMIKSVNDKRFMKNNFQLDKMHW